MPDRSPLPKPLRRWLKLLSAYHAPDEPPDIVPLDYPSSPLYLYVTAAVERRSRAFSCLKEPWTVAWLERVLGPGAVFFDVGANVGAYALIAGRRVGESGRVFAFEPAYASYARLCDNVALNELAHIVTPVPLPVGASTSVGTMNYHRLQPGNARHVVGAPSLTGKGDVPVYRQRVLLARLDDLAATWSLPMPHAMKVDVDGSEVEVLAGGTRLLAAPALRDLLVEVDEHNTDAVLHTLTTSGFRLVERHQRTRDDGTPAPLWYGIFARD